MFQAKPLRGFLSLRQYLSFNISLLSSNLKIKIRNDINFKNKFIYSLSLFINFTKLWISNGFYYTYLFTILLILLILMMSLI